MLLDFCSCVSRNTRINEKGYLYDPNICASYYPFSLCFSALPSTAALRTLVITWRAAAAGIQTFQKKKKNGAFFCRCEMDANLIPIAPKCWDADELTCLHRDTFGRWACFHKR
jgi:hypothetical protein